MFLLDRNSLPAVTVTCVDSGHAVGACGGPCVLGSLARRPGKGHTLPLPPLGRPRGCGVVHTEPHGPWSRGRGEAGGPQGSRGERPGSARGRGR